LVGTQSLYIQLCKINFVFLAFHDDIRAENFDAKLLYPLGKSLVTLVYKYFIY